MPLPRTKNNMDVIQSFSPRYRLGAKAAGTVFAVDGTGDESIADWISIEFDTKSADGVSTFVEGAKLTFNDDANDYRWLDEGKNVIVIYRGSVTQIVANVDTTVCGM